MDNETIQDALSNPTFVEEEYIQEKRTSGTKTKVIEHELKPGGKVITLGYCD